MQVIQKIDSPDFDWLDTQPLIPIKGILMHYTPRWPLMLHYTCAMICFGMSTIYHMMNSHSKKTMDFLVRFDYAGICLMIAGSGTSPIFYSFACEELREWRVFYLAFLWGFCTLTMIALMSPIFDKHDFLRATVFSSSALFNLVPIFHISTKIEAQYLHHFYIFPWAFGVFIYGIGAILYSIKFPEKHFPKTFDIFGSSHQIMHISVVVAALVHYYGSVQVFHDRQLYSCPLPSSRY